MGARREARDALAAANLQPRKRWGQHFLCDPGITRRIVELADVGSEPAVLEIGPGLGALTDALAAVARRLYLVEIDRGLVARLVTRYENAPNVRVVAGDVLELPLADIVEEPRATVVANLPYNITTPVLFRLLELRRRLPRAVVMIQHEVAQRLAAKPGGKAWGVLPVLIQTWADVRIAFRVSRRAFVPPPRVESAVVDVRWRPEPRVDVGDGSSYRAVVRAAFGQRRKMLRNALADLGAARGLDAAALLAAFERAGIDPGLRAERLSIEDFARLARALAARSG
jgi:16S rRNA (adenine1518-N6/adenine1519-N6)-dimethyltransferase